MSSQSRSRRRRVRPPGMWHSIPPWVRAACISFGILAVIFVANGLGASIFAMTGFTIALICYPIQLLAYILNGILAGWQADLTRSVYLRQVGHRGERVRRNLPEFIKEGALAGLLLAILAAVMYFAGTTAVSSLIPLVTLVGFTAPWLLVVVDLVTGTGLGALGGIIYERLLSAPGRR
ncbi:MAG: hypothetical protein DRI79_02085 [Chloroflexi bacterium]|nr:MAG: hypothetical protein DRI79_02085 [Chloroflexota bacterium]